MNGGVMDPRVTELHCIMPMGNISSVLVNGILSYERANTLPHESIAMAPVQERRDQKQVPGGLRLHQYANLYFHARNPMLYKRLGEAPTLAVLRVSTDVLRVRDVVITDCNAASDYARYLAPGQWQLLDFDDIYATDWRHPGNASRYYQHRSRKCAEVLVPHLVDSRFLRGAYVIDVQAEHRLRKVGFNLPIAVNPSFFFAK
ncbi:DUF4433 domain-containing protein [Marilutibacter maris]|uniref:DUF4433 domain-containing protein n=1 Tax=Marilutibacter maris TaxID=1605891 RepID=UPI000DA98A07